MGVVDMVWGGDVDVERVRKYLMLTRGWWCVLVLKSLGF